MNWVDAIVVAIKLLILWFSARYEKDQALKVEKKAALEEMRQGARENDMAKITNAWDRIRRAKYK